VRIGELAARAGTSRDAIRFYERVGIVRGRRLANGYRDFPPEALTRLRHVRTAQELGFSLAEIARLGDELGGVEDPADELSALLEDKIRSVDARLAELTALRAELGARVGTRCPLRARAQGRAAQGRTAQGGHGRG
jgi:MerR family transcriptional regulator, copper efflux regulator